MGKVLDSIDEKLAAWLTSQPVFFVSTAPLAADGFVNCSPKGLQGSFAVLGPHAVAFLDLTGSGVETIAHLHENGRIVLMFCAFQGPPNIVRLHGTGRVVLPEDEHFPSLVERFPHHPGIRSVIVADVQRVADSCGYAVPRLDYVADRPALDRWADQKGPEQLAKYRAQHNATSIEGLPGLPEARGGDDRLPLFSQ